MNKLIKAVHVVLLTSLALLSAPALAEQPSVVVSVRLSELVQKSPQFTAGQAQMRTEFERRKTELEAEGQRFQEELQRYKREGDTMAPDARATKEKDFNTRRIDLEYKQRQLAEDVQKRERELSLAMMTKIQEVIGLVAKERNATLVVQDPVWGAPGTDITADVLKRLQAQK